MAVSLSVAIVAFRTRPELLSTALASLARAAQEARRAGELGPLQVFLVDNDDAPGASRVLGALDAWPSECSPTELLHGHGNVGYGRANNLVVPRLKSDFHLVMNPDVELEPQALRNALAVLRMRPEAGLVAPSVRGTDGNVQYLCKRYPSVWVLFLRGFAPAALRRRFRAAIEHYEMRDVIGSALHAGVPLASGCFMLVRTDLFVRLGGFDPGFFMYFEDYDLSLRLGRDAQVAYVPDARIVHHGGDAARKGLRHVVWFVRSAWRFFSRHGWKLR